MSVWKTVLDVTLSDGVKLVTEARRRVKPYLPLAAELYNELATRSPVSLPKIDVDKLIDDLYPKQDLDPAWAHDAEPFVPATPDEPEADDVDEPAVEAAVSEEAPVEATPVDEPAAVDVPAPVVEVVAEAVVEPVIEVAPAVEVVVAPVVEPAPAVVEAPAPVVEAPLVEAPLVEAPVKPAKAAAKAAKLTEKPASKPKAKPRGRKKDDAQQTLIAPAPAKPRYTLDALLEMKKADLLDLAREHKLELKPSATKQAIAEAILGA